MKKPPLRGTGAGDRGRFVRPRPRRARRRRAVAAAAAASSVLLTLSAVGVLVAGPEPGMPPPVAAPERSSAPAPGTEMTAAPASASAAVPEIVPNHTVLTEPARIVVPAIGVDTRVVPLGLDPEGRLEVPSGPDEAGWWTGGAAPGAPGPAVVAGHVDSLTGPAIFHRLRELLPGDQLVLRGAQGDVAFEVDRVEQHPKDAFPTREAYGSTDRPTLRLTTCGGVFHPATGHYDNVIVYAILP